MSTQDYVQPGDTDDYLSQIARRQSQSLSSMVSAAIEKMILAGELTAGQRLSEHALAAKLGVSRGPIREALRLLEHSGLVVSKTNSGVFVRMLSEEEAAEVYELRAALFGLLCRRVAENLNQDQEDALRGLLAKMDEAAAAEDLHLYYKLNLQFHAMIVEFATRKRVKAAYEALIKELHQFRRQGLNGVGNMLLSSREHRAIFEALVSGNAALARDLGENHVLDAFVRWRSSRSEQVVTGGSQLRPEANEGTGS